MSTFLHVNIVARDWRRLAGFYGDTFGCCLVPPERDLAGDWLDRATGISNAHIRGVHLRLPGLGRGAPTLEVFEYAGSPRRSERPAVDTLGFAHVAFAVDCLEAKVLEVVANGGEVAGEAADVRIPAGPRIRFQYVRDPEGNVIEVQEGGGGA